MQRLRLSVVDLGLESAESYACVAIIRLVNVSRFLVEAHVAHGNILSVIVDSARVNQQRIQLEQFFGKADGFLEGRDREGNILEDLKKL